MALLFWVNKIWGPISEILDTLEVIKENLIIDGVRMSKWTDWETIFKKMENADSIDVDVDKLMIDYVEMQIEDLVIGQLSQAEKNAMLRAFGESHLVNNMMGSPSTWLRRMNKLSGGEPITNPIVEQVSVEMDKVRKAAEKTDRALEKLKEEYLDAL